MQTTHVKLGELLVNLQMIKPEQLTAALASQKSGGGRLGSNLVRLGFISEMKLMDILAHQLNIPKINLRRSHIRVDALAHVKRELCRKHCLIPVAKKFKGNLVQLLVAMSDPTDMEAVHNVEFAGDCRVTIAVAPESDITHLIDFCYTEQGLRECRGELDMSGGLTIELKENEDPEEEFVLLTSEEEHASMMNYKIDPTLRDLIDLLVRKRTITWDEAQELLRRTR